MSKLDHPEGSAGPPEQLSLDLAGSNDSAERAARRRDLGRGARAGLAHLGRRLLYWSPAALALAFLLQMAWFGLRPARAESLRLDHAEAGVRAREDALVRDHEAQTAARRMLADEIYRERVRKSLLDVDRPPLTIASLNPGG